MWGWYAMWYKKPSAGFCLTSTRWHSVSISLLWFHYNFSSPITTSFRYGHSDLRFLSLQRKHSTSFEFLGNTLNTKMFHCWIPSPSWCHDKLCLCLSHLASRNIFTLFTMNNSLTDVVYSFLGLFTMEDVPQSLQVNVRSYSSAHYEIYPIIAIAILARLWMVLQIHV